MPFKTSAFTLLELLVVILIVGILSTLSAPMLRETYERYTLNEDFTKLYDTILEARNLALSQKVCRLNPAEYWGVAFDDQSTYRLLCRGVDQSSEEIIRTETLTSNHTLAVYDGSADKTDADLRFLPSQLTSEIFFEGGSTIKDEIRVVLSNTDIAEERTICFNAIGGFPEINDNGSSCP